MPWQIGTWSRWVEGQFEQKEEKSDSNNNEKSDSENFRLFHLLKQVERSIDASLQNACTKREGTDYTARNSLLISKHFGLISTSRSCLKNYQYFGKDSQNKRLEMIET